MKAYKPLIPSLMLACLAGTTLMGGRLTGKVTVKAARNNADAVVYIDTIAGKEFEPPAEHVVMDQKEMVFEPHVLPVLVGTTVDFLNSDPLLHNVFTPDKCADKFNLGSWPKGQIKSYTFKKPCVAVLLCNVHPEMEAFILALPTPYFARTDRSGAFVIEGVPDGDYTVKAWHPKGKEAAIEVKVSGETAVNFELKR